MAYVVPQMEQNPVPHEGHDDFGFDDIALWNFSLDIAIGPPGKHFQVFLSFKCNQNCANILKQVTGKGTSYSASVTGQTGNVNLSIRMQGNRAE